MRNARLIITGAYCAILQEKVETVGRFRADDCARYLILGDGLVRNFDPTSAPAKAIGSFE
jgi:hypothetical protein